MIRPDLPKIARSRKSLIPLVAGIVAAVGVWACTAPPGPGLDPDAAAYLGAARSLANGQGYRVPIVHWTAADSTAPLTHFPPGYPTVIAAPLLLGLSAAHAARLVNAVAAFVAVTVAVWLVIDAAGVIAGVTLAAALLVMHAMVIIHLSVLSEPLFLACLVCVLATMHLIARAPNERARTRASLAGGLAAAAAVLMRYAGISALAAIVLWTFLPPATLRVRLRHALVAALPSVLLVGAWVVHVSLTSGPRSIRSLGAYGDFGETMSEGLSTIVGWLIPLTSDDTLPAQSWLALALLVAIVFVAIRGAWLGRQSKDVNAIGAGALLAISYVVVLMASRLLADPGIPFDERLLSPLFILVTIMLALAIPRWWAAARWPARVLCAVLLTAWLGASFRASADEVGWVLENGQDFTQAQWTESPLLAWARANATRQPLYTNWPAAIVFHLHRTAREVPDTADAAVLGAFADTVRAHHGIVLAFDQPSPDQIGPEALIRAPGLRQIVRVADGVVLAADSLTR